MITTEIIKELRDRTGVSIMQCQKALEETDGDLEKAIVVLQKKSGDIAEKKASRSLGAGIVESYVHNTGNIGVLVEISCETDFVANNKEFKEFAYNVAMQVAATNPKFLKSEDISEEEVEKAKDVFQKEVKDKPDDLKGKILQGKVDSYFKEQVLLNQSYIKDPEKTVNDLVSAAIQKFGERIEIRRFVRFSTKD